MAAILGQTAADGKSSEKESAVEPSVHGIADKSGRVPGLAQTDSSSPAAEAADVQPAGVDAPLDIVGLMDVFVGDTELIRSVLEKFERTMCDALAEISAGFDDADRQRVTRAAHALKGTASYLSAGEITRRATTIENWTDATPEEAIRGEIDALQAEVGRTIQFIPTVLEQLPTCVHA